MNENTVEITQTSDYTVSVDTSLIQNENNIIVELSSPNTIDVINNTTILVGDLPQGYPLDWTVGDLPISRVSGLDIIGGSGINVINDSGQYTVSLSNPTLYSSGIIDFTEAVQDVIGNSGLVGGNYININYNDSLGLTTISATGLQPSGNYSVVGHTHTSSNITDFASSVSGLLPVKNISAGSGIGVSSVSGNFTVAVTGQFGLTGEQVDDRVSELLIGGPYINLSYDDLNNKLTINATGLQPSGSYAPSIHNHTSSDITNFNSSVSGLVDGIYAPLISPNFSGIPTTPTAPSGTNNNQIANTQFVRTEISNLINSAPSTLDTLNELANALGDDPNFATTVASGLGTKAPLAHTHTVNDITNFTSGVQDNVSTLLVPGNYIDFNYNAINDSLTISVTGLQESVTNILGGSGISVSNVGSVYTIATTGQFGLTGEEVDDRVGNLLVSGTGISLDYNDSNNTLSIASSGLAFTSGANFDSLSVSGVPVSVSGHLHDYTDIINWASGIENEVSTLLVAGNYININYDNLADTLTINATGLQPSGNYANSVHTHSASDITNFNSAVSGLIPVKHIVSGTDISVTNVSGIYTINSTVNTVSEAGSLVTTVFNKTGSPIPKMSAVYIDGGQGDTPTVALAIATGDPTSAGTYGLTFETIPNMSTGKVVVFGGLTGLNTDQFNPTAPHGDVNGQVLYLSPTTPGGLTLTKPSAPNHMVAIGTIVRTHQNQGVIEVRVQNGFELEELHNVAISGVAGGQFLQYNGSGLWVPSSSGNFSTLLVNGTGVSLNGHTHSSANITDFNSSVSGLLPVTNIVGGTNITVSQSGTVYSVAVAGSLGLTTEEVDDRVASLLVAGSGINLNYNDNSNTLTVSVSGLTSSAIIGNGSGNVISYNLNEALNVVGSGSTTVTYNDSTNTINISSPSLIREYELVSSTKSTFTVTGGYALNNLDVYHNGIKLLDSGDYTATNGTSFTLIQPAVSGDVVEWLGYSVVPRHQLILGEVRSDTVGNINYLGRAVAGSPEASGVWTIKKYTVADNGIDITTATASNAIWNNRLTETYL